MTAHQASIIAIYIGFTIVIDDAVKDKKVKNMDTHIPAEQYTLYAKAANRYIDSTKSGLSFYLKFQITLLIASIISIIIIFYLLVTSSLVDKITELLGTGTIFSIVLMYSLYQIQKCWCCKNSCNIAIFHIDIEQPQVAFEFMQKSACLKQGGEELINKMCQSK